MNEKENMKRDLIVALASLLIEDHPDYNIDKALSEVFNSDTYLKLMDDATGLYYQSPRYVYSFLKTEMETGVLA